MPAVVPVSFMRCSNWVVSGSSVRGGGTLARHLDVDDLELRRAAGCGDRNLLAHLLLEHSAADRRGMGELPASRVGLVGADDLERPLLSPVNDPQGHPGPEVHGVVVGLGRVDHLYVAHLSLEIADPALQQILFVFRVVVLGVLRDVAELACLPDTVGDLLAAHLGKICEFLVELLETFRGDELLILVSHKPRDYTGGVTGCQRSEAAGYRRQPSGRTVRGAPQPRNPPPAKSDLSYRFDRQEERCF